MTPPHDVPCTDTLPHAAAPARRARCAAWQRVSHNAMQAVDQDGAEDPVHSLPGGPILVRDDLPGAGQPVGEQFGFPAGKPGLANACPIDRNCYRSGWCIC
jgi:hypothetical protein